MSVVAHKNYLADKKPFFKHFHPRDITITAVRSAVMQGAMVANFYMASLALEEMSDEEDPDSEDDEIDRLKKKAKKELKDQEPYEPPSPQEFTLLCLTSFVKSISVTTYLRSLEEAAIHFCRPQVVGKLVKDSSKSATRKYLRHHSRWSAATMMVKTGMRANMLSHLAIFLVEETQQIILILYRKFVSKETKNSKKSQKKLRGADDKKVLDEEEDTEEEHKHPTFLEITTKNAYRSSIAVVTGGIGAAVGTLIRPGLGTVIGATLGDTVGYLM
ncbi:hypothetical protein Poli38472_001344 [Pythium oligandrum]|uniref:Uncharacterized protein n=1 Tax=Pythium oligandrum TaxID=41045 RepID=A0A8K1CVU9_PYTOL|nr:hypothetical protein Poli38472_001344 [Pythium oligandrum]|eukprot:TMW69188.1 hypothetical protein Poli38472_001344 [Pythium oligandrum]